MITSRALWIADLGFDVCCLLVRNGNTGLDQPSAFSDAGRFGDVGNNSGVIASRLSLVL